MTEDEREQEETRYSIDIRAFLVWITITMVVAFTLGVAMRPSHQKTKSKLPEVTSAKLHPEIPSDTDALHEPAGQVRIGRRARCCLKRALQYMRSL
jgi:hypothetical protein